MINVLNGIFTITGLGIIFGLGLAYAHKIFHVAEDPRLEKILACLPGANCGACGFAGCHAAAEALAKGEASVNICAPNIEEEQQKLACLLGVEVATKTKLVATVFCDGGVKAVDKFAYRGIQSCKADINFMQGHKMCSYACVGQGDCMRACPFDAIYMKDELPVIVEDKCTACGKCVVACPRNLIELIPKAARIYVKCSSLDKAPLVRKVCKSGCIACGICVKKRPDIFKLEDNLAKVYDFTKKENLEDAAFSCPTKVIILK